MMKDFKLTASLITLILAGIAPGVAQQAKPQAPGVPTRDAEAKALRGGAEPECANRKDGSQALDEDDEYVRSIPRLSRAAATGDVEKVRGLLKRGASVSDKDPLGFTALMFAAAAGHLDVVKVLLGAGADPNAAGGIAHVGHWSVLTMAMNRCNGNWEEVVDTLIAAGAKVNPPAGLVPLTDAIAQRRDLVLIKALLKRGADVNLHGGAPLEAAVTVAVLDVEIVKVLLAAGADPNLPRLNVGDEEMSLLAYLEQYIEGSRDGERDETDEARDEIVRLLKQAGAKR